jgi:hypothetical protein
MDGLRMVGLDTRDMALRGGQRVWAWDEFMYLEYLIIRNAFLAVWKLISSFVRSEFQAGSEIPRSNTVWVSYSHAMSHVSECPV